MKNVIQGTTLSGTGAVSIAPRTEITIRNPAGQLVPLWADRAGTQPHDNPFLTDDEGNFRVYADSGWVHIRAQKDGSVREWRYVPLGSAAAMDIGEIYEALGSGIYSSVSEGLSNSAEGDYFLVESSGSLDLYRVVNGVAEQRAAGIDDNAILATRAYADDVAAEAESNATNAAVAAASAAYQQATEYSDSRLQAHRESDDHDGRYYTKTEVDHALEDKVDENDPRLSDAREWIASTVSQAEAEAGTSTTRRAWTAERVRQAIVAAYNALTSAFGRTLANASDATAARNTLGLGTAATRDVGTGANNVVVGSDPRLSDAREWTAEVVSQAEAEAGTSSVPRKWTAERVRQAIEALGGGGIDPGDLGTIAQLISDKIGELKGKRMLFLEATAPPGWTQDTTINDRVLRIVNSAGGGVGGSWTISGLSASVSVGATTLSVSQIPSHDHVQRGAFYSSDGLGATTIREAPNADIGNTRRTGGGGSHTHSASASISSNGTWRPAYVDVIACRKD